jgi:predicted O-methyltransferase YrrM
MKSGQLTAFIQDWVTRQPSASTVALLEGADRWAIGLPMAHLLEGLTDCVKPHSVLEFGAGRSSIILAAALQTSGRARLTSVDHDATFARALWAQVSGCDLVDAHLITAPLALRLSKFGLLYEYTLDRSMLETRGPFDFVFIDGPPGKFGRESTLLRAAPYLTNDCVVLLDDAARHTEQTCVRRWERALGCERVFESFTLGRGAVVLKIQTRRTRWSARTFLGTLQDRYQRLRTHPRVPPVTP